MRVIARKTLVDFWRKPGRQDAEKPLRAWFDEAQSANWTGPADIKAGHRTASFVANNRVIFNVCGNRYRLVVAVRYQVGIVYVRFVGTHVEYDKIDPVEV